MKRALSFMLALVLALGTTGFKGVFAQPAFVGESTKQFQDFFMATPLREDLGSTLDPNAWGAQTIVEWSDTQTVGARDQNNGLEDRNLGDANKASTGKLYWDYWDGGVIKADDGKFHIIASRWNKGNGHGGWTNSTAIHAVSDDLYGPYTDLGLTHTQSFNGLVGAGHNVSPLELHPDDLSGYRYAYTTSDGNNPAWGRAWGSNDLYNWTEIGRFFNAPGSNVDFAGNFVVMRAPADNEFGRYISIGRQFEVATADNILGPWTLRFRGFNNVPGSPTQDMEDPLMFYLDGLYHAVFNQWSTMRAFWYISENGVDGWKLQPGYAYNPRQDLIYYENEQGERYHVNHWGKMERPLMYMEDGLPVAVSFAAINSAKNDDRNLNDNNGSKIVIIPFDGAAFRDYVRTKVTRGATTITATEDAYVAADAQTANYGASGALAARKSAYNGDNFGETTPNGTDGAANISYLKFDLAQYAEAASVGAAQLELMYQTKSGFPADIFDELYVVSADNSWTETGITWQNKPALDFEGGISVSSPIDLNYSSRLPRLRVTADVTALVNNQLARGNTEVTLAFCQTFDVSQSLAFDSRHSENAGFRPALSVVEKPDLPAAIADAEAELAARMPDAFAYPKTGVNAALRAAIDAAKAVDADAQEALIALRELSDSLAVFRDAYAALDGLLGLVTEAQTALAAKQSPYQNPIEAVNLELATEILAAQGVAANAEATATGIVGAEEGLSAELDRFARVYAAYENGLTDLVASAKAALAEKQPDVFPLADEETNTALQIAIDAAEAFANSMQTAQGDEILAALSGLDEAFEVFKDAYVFSVSMNPGADRLLFAPQTVTIDGPVNENIEYRYTLDGTEPTAKSALYNGSSVELTEGIANMRAAMFIKATGEQYGATAASDYMVVPAYNSAANIAYNKPAFTPNNIYAGQGPDRAVNGTDVNRLSWAGSAGTYTLRVDLGEAGPRAFNTVTLEEYAARTVSFSVYGSDTAHATNGAPADGVLLGQFTANDLNLAKNYRLPSQNSYDPNRSFYGLTLSAENTYRYVYLVMDCSVEGSIWQFGLYNLASAGIDSNVFTISGATGTLTVVDLSNGGAVAFEPLQASVPDAQAWKIEYRNDRQAYTVTSTATGRVLTAAGGAGLRQSAYTGTDAQLWVFDEGVLVSKTDGSLVLTTTETENRQVRYLANNLTVSAPVETVYADSTLQFGIQYDPQLAASVGVDWIVVPGTGGASIDANGLLTGESIGSVSVCAKAKIGGVESNRIDIRVIEREGVELVGDVIWVGDPALSISQGSSGNGGSQSRNFGNLKTDNYNPNTIGLFFPANTTDISKNFINGLDNQGGSWAGYVEAAVQVPEAGEYTLNILCQGNSGRRYEVTVNGESRGITEGVVADASSPLVYSTNENLNVLQLKTMLRAGKNTVKLQAPSGGDGPNYVALAVSRVVVPLEVAVVNAPDTDLQLSLWLEEGQPYYSIVYKGKELVSASRLGLETSSAAVGSLSSGFTGLTETSNDSGDSTWSPVVGEKAVVHDKYNERVIRLNKGESGNLSIEMRAYNTGVAFRYLLPDADEVGDYRITEEQTRFDIAPEGDVLFHRNGQQTVASRARIDNIPSADIYPPMTAVFDDGTAMTLAVANLDNYVYNRLRTNAEGRLKPTNAAVNVTAAGPDASTYWTFVIGDSLADLPNNKDIILNLNNEPDEEKYGFSEWVKPGKAWMMGLFSETTDTMKDKIDLAKEIGLEYILMDFGWYGPEFYKYSDPRLDPTKLVADPGDSEELAAAKAFMRQYVTEDGVFDAREKPFNVYESWYGNIQMAPYLNVPEIINYGNEQGVGIFLYVNNVQLYDQLNRFTVDDLFSQFAKWGVKGVKPGFVANKSQAGEATTRQLVETAAKHKLMLTIHDDWIQSGIEREFPNLLTSEGVYGDEGVPNDQIEGDLNALFARGLQGFADHTICYPGKATRGFQLASSVLWPTGLNCVYWPWRNTDTGNQAAMERLPEREKDFWRVMPATWDELVILEAEVSASAATARRTGDRWYLGAISAVVQEMRLSLDFLDENTQYVAELYQDRPGNNGSNANRDNRTGTAELLVANFKVDAQTVLTRQMAFGTGIAAIIRPIEPGEENLPEYGAYNAAYNRLAGLLAQCDALERDAYAADNWLQVSDAMASATQLLGDTETSVDALSAAYDRLKTAVDSLVVIREVLRVETETDTTIQGWKAYNGDEQTRNYGGVNVLRVLSNLSGQYGKYGQGFESIGVSNYDAKIGFIKFELPAGQKIVGGKLSFTGQGVRDNATGSASLAVVPVTPNDWQEGNSSGNSDVPIDNIGDAATWRHLGADLNYQFAFDFESERTSETFSLSGFSGKKVEIDVTDVLNGYVGGDTVSFAIFETLGKEIWLHSSESSTAANRPVLVLYLESDAQPDVTVSFDAAYDGAPAIPDVTVKKGEALGLNMPTPPNRPGYAFNGFTDTFDVIVTKDTPIDTDTVLTAQWLKYLDIAVKDGSVTLTASLKAGGDLAAADDAQVLLAIYDTDGRLLFVKIAKTTVSAALQTEVISAGLPENAALVKAFLWSGGNAPLLVPAEQPVR